jgi:hypothetical protein
LILAVVVVAGQAMADTVLTLTTWRIEPSTVKENQPWTVKIWVGNVGGDAPKKPTVVQVLGCDKDYAKCETVYATQEIKSGAPEEGQRRADSQAGESSGRVPEVLTARARTFASASVPDVGWPSGKRRPICATCNGFGSRWSCLRQS